MPLRSTPMLAPVLAALVLLGHLAQVLHQAAHVHVFCGAHDRMEHAGHLGAGCDGGAPHPEDPSRPPEEDDGHDPCPFLPPALSDGDQPRADLPVGALRRAGTSPAPGEPLYAGVLWLLAPKHSPPVAV